MCWYDRRLEQSGMTPISTTNFSLSQAEGSYSQADHCIYITKMKLAPGHIDFDRLTSATHRKAFLDARIKEVQSLIDNKAIKILSSEESRAFQQDHPDCVLPSRYVDGWKPSGDGKFSTLPEHFDDPGFEPLNHPEVLQQSRDGVLLVGEILGFMPSRGVRLHLFPAASCSFCRLQRPGSGLERLRTAKQLSCRVFQRPESSACAVQCRLEKEESFPVALRTNWCNLRLKSMAWLVDLLGGARAFCRCLCRSVATASTATTGASCLWMRTHLP